MEQKTGNVLIDKRILHMMTFQFCPDGGIGRHKGLKIPRLNGRAGSIPAPGTTHTAVSFLRVKCCR